MKQFLFFDMDGVLVDFDKKLQTMIAAGHPADCYKTCENFYLDMEPMPGAIEAFGVLSKFYDCYILSAPSWSNTSSYSDKRIWVEQHLGKLAKKKLILTHNKGMFSGRALIDDRTKYGVKEFNGEHIHFGTSDFPDWGSVLRHLVPVKKKEEIWEEVVSEAEERDVIFATNDATPYFTSSSLHIFEERYHTEMGTYRLLTAIGDKESGPLVEKLVS